MKEKLQETYQYLSNIIGEKPEVGIVLGTGLGRLVNEIKIQYEISYADIPNFPVSTVETHDGKLVFGQLGTKKVLAMQGRFHFYEGYTMQQITFPIRIMKMMGINILYISNVSGAMNYTYHKGDLVILEDHINLQTTNPLTGPNLDEFGPRFPDMSRPYDEKMIHTAWQIAKAEGYSIHKGTYVAVNGPNLETRAEYKFLRSIGGDMVGMSTVPEVIVANHMSMKVFAASIITDICNPDELEPINIEEIIRIANEAEPKLTRLFYRMINEQETISN